MTGATAQAICLIRDMINTPAGVMDPAGLEQAARMVVRVAEKLVNRQGKLARG